MGMAGTGTAKKAAGAAVGGGIAAPVASAVGGWVTEWLGTTGASAETVGQTEMAVVALVGALIMGGLGYARENRVPILGAIGIVFIVALSVGCGGKIGKLGLTASDGGTSVTYESPALEGLGCNAGWFAKFREFIGAPCESDSDSGGGESAAE